MSTDYGVKIRLIEAGSLYGYNNGARDRYEYKVAMLSNSLFLDFLKENGLKIQSNGFTKDIISISFGYGSRSFDEEVTHLKNTREKYEKLKDKDETIRKIDDLILYAESNQEKFIKKSKEEIRDIFYEDGVYVEYTTRNKNGEVTKSEKIHYKMLFRSTGKAKTGSCMFIRDKLYKKCVKFLRMGITVPKHNAKIVEISAYSPLVASTIVGKIQIEPENILIIKDIDSFFKTKVVSIETDEHKRCIAKDIEDYELKNTIFDGQALIDENVFPDYGNGYVLLRHHFCKMAAFSTNIQMFFKDYFGEKYDTAEVTDMFGVIHKAKDIKLITTDNAMKWIKFNISYQYWCDKVHENDCMFGVVKTAHESKLGNVQRMSYQMMNCLNMATMDKVVERSVDYINKLKADEDVFLDYLEKNKNFSNDYDVLVALVQQNHDFVNSQYFRDRKKKIINSYVLNFKNGRSVQNADNLVIVGSPYAMLLASVGEPIEKDDTFAVEAGTIQCYTERFDDGEYLAEFRSPFNSPNNLGYLHNVLSEKIKKYFNLGKLCIAVNMIGTDFQDRNNGSDMDSDSIYTTNQPEIVAHAKYCYEYFPTIVNNIPRSTKTYDNTPINFSTMDNNLASAQMAIGESSNLAQIALTYSYNFEDQKYRDYVCILSVLAQVAIDNAKRAFDIDLTKEIDRIKKDMDIKTNGYPEFWGVIKKDFNRKLINKDLICPMNYVCNVKFKSAPSTKDILPMSYFFNKFTLEEDRRRCKKVEDLIQKYSLSLYNSDETDYEENIMMRDDFNQMILDIRQVYLSKSYIGLMSWLIDRAFGITTVVKNNKATCTSVLNKNRPILLKTLYSINPKNLLECFSKNAQNCE